MPVQVRFARPTHPPGRDDLTREHPIWTTETARSHGRGPTAGECVRHFWGASLALRPARLRVPQANFPREVIFSRAKNVQRQVHGPTMNTGRSMVRRSQQSPLAELEPSPLAFSFGSFRVFPNARRLECDGSPIPLGSRAFDLLCLLVSRPGEVVSKDDLMARAWPDLTVEESNLRFHIAQLRRILSAGQRDGHYIRNVPGRGYCFVAPVDRVWQVPKPASPAYKAPNDNRPAEPALVAWRDAEIRALTEHLLARRSVMFQLQSDSRSVFAFLDLGSREKPDQVVTVAASLLRVLASAESHTRRLLDLGQGRELLLVLHCGEHVVEAAA